MWVFLSTPIVVLPFVLLFSLVGVGVDLPGWAVVDPKSTIILVLTLPMLVSYVIVKIYYWRQDARHAEPLQSRVENSEKMK